MSEGLDPRNESEWENQRILAHKVVDDMFYYLKRVRDRPVWKKPDKGLLSLCSESLPTEGKGLDATYELIQKNILPHSLGNIHPRFWGWVTGTGTFSGALADMIASSLNSNCGGGDHGAIEIEKQVINWAKEMMGFPQDSSGLLTTGGSIANLTGLTVARHVKAGYDLRKEGVIKPLIVYGSTETHSSIQKSVELLGIGASNYRKIPVNSDFQIDCNKLEEQIINDIEADYTPICVIGTIGTVNTGAIDDIPRLREITDRYGLWLHVDGAFGSLTRLSSKYRYLAEGLDSADSLAFDFHKWMSVNYEIGCVLIKNKDTHKDTFSYIPEYLEHSVRGVHGTDMWFSDYGLELSRNFKALKAWTMIQELGIKRFGETITMNIDQAKYLSSLIEAHPDLELIAPTSMNIVCFRYISGHRDLNLVNEEILFKLHESGVAVPSYTKIDGKYAIRVANTNHRSRFEDFNLLIEKVVEFGREC